jgi:glycosyltransferase 2 family protein
VAFERRVLTVAAALALGLAASVWVLRSLPLSDAPARLVNVGPGLVLALLPFLLTLGFDTLAWRALLGAAGARVPFHSLFRIRLAAEGAGILLPSAGLVQEMVALRALSLGAGVPVARGLASLAARRFALIHAHGMVLAVGAGLLFLSAGSAPRRGLCIVLAIASLALMAAGRLGPRWLLVPSLLDRAERSLDGFPGQTLRRWAARHRHQFADSGRILARINRGPDAPAWTASLAFLLAFVSEAFESFVMLRLLGSPIGFVQVLSFDSAVGLARALVAFVPAGLGVQEAGYAAFLLGAGGPDAAGLVASFVVLKRLKEALYCALGLTLVACLRSSPGETRDEPARAGPLRLRLPQPDHPDA